MSRTDPFDELGVEPGASEDEIKRAYQRRVVERHRQGVWSITDQLRRAQRAFAALSDPLAHERLRRERQQRESARLEDRTTVQNRQLALLRRYKAEMNRDLERIDAESAERHAGALAEIDRQIALEELRSRELARRHRRAATARSALLLVLFLAAVAALWVGLRGA